MVFVIIQDMEDELIRIGSGRSRGLGKIKAIISEQEEGYHSGGIVLSAIRKSKQEEPDREVWGLARWLEHETVHDTRRDDLLQLSQSVAGTPHGVRNIRVFKGDALTKQRELSISYFVVRIQQWPDSPGEAVLGAADTET